MSVSPFISCKAWLQLREEFAISDVIYLEGQEDPGWTFWERQKLRWSEHVKIVAVFNMNSMEKNPLRKEEGILSRKNPLSFIM